jgi:hypothetical protein
VRKSSASPRKGNANQNGHFLTVAGNTSKQPMTDYGYDRIEFGGCWDNISLLDYY